MLAWRTVGLWIVYVFVLLLYILGRFMWSWYRDDTGSMDSSIMTDCSSLYPLRLDYFLPFPALKLSPCIDTAPAMKSY